MYTQHNHTTYMKDELITIDRYAILDEIKIIAKLMEKERHILAWTKLMDLARKIQKFENE